MHETISAGVHFAGDLIGYTGGLFLTVLLLVLALRAARLPGAQPANLIFAGCAFLWSLGGLMQTVLRSSGIESNSRWVMLSQAIQYSSALAFPIPVLAVWRPFAAKAGREAIARLLEIAARISAVVLGALIWIGPLLGTRLLTAGTARTYAAYNATVLLAGGAVLGLRRNTTPRSVYVPSLAIVVSAGIAAAMMTLARLMPSSVDLGFGFSFVLAHLILLVVLCAFFLFARFRFADVFVRYAIRILLAATWAALLVSALQSPLLMHISMQARYPQAVHIFAMLVVANALLLSFTLVDDRISARLIRWLFRAPDYAAVRRELAVRLSGLEAEDEIFATVAASVRTPMELASARVVPADAAVPAEVLEGDVVELGDVRVMVPIATGGRVTHAMLLETGSARPRLVMQDLNYLRTVAALCGNRLDALQREREAAERQNREALLEQQVTEAELRALRAQINPHFLFNALNTVADLIVRDPVRAEKMTLRLATVFRHVLANSSRPLASVRDEIEFLRTYLHIEEARFGDRLHVEIELDPSIEAEQLPSLILQPLVENALKHGLGPKTGPGRLRISATAAGAEVELRVEDDGMGLRSPGSGLGLANVKERLTTLYGDRASFLLEPREGGGTRATVRIPRG